MCMSRRITFIVGFTVYPRKSPDHSLFCHCFDISVHRCTTDFRIFLFHFVKDIFCWKMSALAGVTNDVSILVLSHGGYYENTSRKIKKKKRRPTCGLPFADTGDPLPPAGNRRSRNLSCWSETTLRSLMPVLCPPFLLPAGVTGFLQSCHDGSPVSLFRLLSHARAIAKVKRSESML